MQPLRLVLPTLGLTALAACVMTDQAEPQSPTKTAISTSVQEAELKAKAKKAEQSRSDGAAANAAAAQMAVGDEDDAPATKAPPPAPPPVVATPKPAPDPAPKTTTKPRGGEGTTEMQAVLRAVKPMDKPVGDAPVKSLSSGVLGISGGKIGSSGSTAHGGIGRGVATGTGGLGTRGVGKGGGGSTGYGALALGNKAKKKSGRYVGPRRERLAAQPELQGNFEGRWTPNINAHTLTSKDALSTFAVDVDTAAYSIARRSLNANRMPTPSLVRIEEMINYFRYDYDAPTSKPFSIQVDGAKSPVDGDVHMLRVGIQSQIVKPQDRLPSNIVFLVDTSCSMTSRDKLSLAKKSIEIAVDHLSAQDKVAITTYAGGVKTVLPPTSAKNKAKIKRAIRHLRPGGGTAMESGMTLAYRQAAAMLAPNTNTRIIVCSDGDANIGGTSHSTILSKVKHYVSEGVRLSTIGYGQGNYKDQMMEQLANKGNGNYYYIDSPRMAARVFGRDLTQMLQDVAQDVKIQVEFNKETVKSYRLVGYENRNVADRDFRNDEVDAGEIGAGHQVTALYELKLATDDASANIATVRVRAKRPRGIKASETAKQVNLRTVQRPFANARPGMKFATAAMGGAELLRHSPYAAAWSFDRVISILSDFEGSADPDKAEFLALMKKARRLSGSRNQHLSTR